MLGEQNDTLGAMAQKAYASPFHLSRVLRRHTGEAPMAMRRRVMLERAAWSLHRGSSVIDAAWEAGYESVEGFSRAFSRAFGRPPSQPGDSYRLPAPNGVHFHPPFNLWVTSTEQAMSPLIDVQLRHDLDDTRDLVEVAKGVPDAALREVRIPGAVITPWEGPEESIHAVLERQVWAKEVWLAAIDGSEAPTPDHDGDVASLIERQRTVGARWIATVRDIEQRRGWDDLLVDALCEPPESFVLGGVVAHVLTFAAARRQLARLMFRLADVAVDDGDPILWERR